MDSWWQLGEWSGHRGGELAIYRIACAFCLERGNFKTVHHAEKKKANGRKVLNFDTLQCGSCGSYALVLWSASEMQGSMIAHDYRVLPWPLTADSFNFSSADST